MGKYEREARSKLFNGKRITKTRFTLIDFLLYPYRAIKNWNKRRLIRKEWYRSMSWVYKNKINKN